MFSQSFYKIKIQNNFFIKFRASPSQQCRARIVFNFADFLLTFAASCAKNLADMSSIPHIFRTFFLILKRFNIRQEPCGLQQVYDLQDEGIKNTIYYFQAGIKNAIFWPPPAV